MTRVLIGIHTVFLFQAIFAMHASAEQDPVESIYGESQRKTTGIGYLIPSIEQLSRFKILFSEVAGTQNQVTIKDLSVRFSSLGFELVHPSSKKKPGVTVLREKEKAGKGIYLMNDCLNKTRPVLIQTPHSKSDKSTGEIGLLLFMNTAASGFFSSTVKRNAEPTGSMDRSKSPMADLAHQEKSFFMEATRVFAEKHPDLLVIQLHGFESDDTRSGRNYSMIISGGKEDHSEPELWSRWIEIFKKAYPKLPIAFYGRDTDVLGATTNTQGKFIHKHSSGQFLHIEMSPDFRQELVKSKHARDDFIHVIEQVISTYETY